MYSSNTYNFIQVNGNTSVFSAIFGLNIFISFYNYTSIQTYMMIIQVMGLERKLKAYTVLLPLLFLKERTTPMASGLLSWTIKASKCGSTLKGRICSSRSKFFPLRVDPN